MSVPIRKRFFSFTGTLTTEYTAEQVHNPRMSECRTSRRWSSQEVMDKLFRSDPRPCTPDGGRSGATMARGFKDTSSRPAKDLGGTLRRTLRTTLRSYDSRASGDRNVPIARGAWQMWRVNFSKSDTMRWQLRLPAHSCDFESNNHIFDRKGDHLWKN